MLGGPGVFALDVEGVCCSESGCEVPDVFDDWVGFAWPIDMVEVGTGAGFGVEGTVDEYRMLLLYIEALGVRLRVRNREMSVRRQPEQIMM